MNSIDVFCRHGAFFPSIFAARSSLGVDLGEGWKQRKEVQLHFKNMTTYFLLMKEFMHKCSSRFDTQTR